MWLGDFYALSPADGRVWGSESRSFGKKNGQGREVDRVKSSLLKESEQRAVHFLLCKIYLFEQFLHGKNDC
jgi:hypothetical protein